MIIEINKVITYSSSFEVKQSGDKTGFVISIENESGPRVLYVTREELELISKAIKEELEKAGK